MPDRNIYKDELDFAVLALQSPPFNKYLKSNGQLDFSNPEAVQQLTKSLLERDFGLKLELPNDRLCPPVPNRFNYILWIQDLLDTTSDSYTDQYDPEREVIGLDIGTGSSCIYPLLGCSQRPKWKFVATDVDEKNIEYARSNVIRNNLKPRIRPLRTKPTDPLIPLDALGLESIDFTMCNPPFYTSTADLLSSAAAKSRPPHSACTGADVEMVTVGGEVAFVSRMIDESKLLGERCQWYTSMLGKYTSVETIVERLVAVGIHNWAVKDLIQGNKTRRWSVAWSWGSMRPSQSVARGTSTLPKHLLPFPSESTFTVNDTSVDSCARSMSETLHSLDVKFRYRPILGTGLGFADGNVWSRAARRKKQQVRHDSTNHVASDNESDDSEPVFGFKVQLNYSEKGSVVLVRWIQGRDSVLFESFCGMLKRELTRA
ncbi:hypothetical protein JMJ35_003950 [Cladonia borealis]|uniref:U6 small nuclear RNA (adenine-(43)-N(6))-methyltransferase n=1 Tax=Cladonia borealis TaxID=184061 RepID=A0AA39R3V7_9LECA|nr:hypothetical protein JMJ35_003950 [Cladonia borealis]